MGRSTAIDRRDLLTAGLALAGVSFGIPAIAQNRRALIGFLSSGSAKGAQSDFTAVEAGLREGGVQKDFYRVYSRFAEYNSNRLTELATDMISKSPSVIIAASRPAAQVLKATTDTVPILFYMGNDPVSLGLVQSLGHPGGNVSGWATMNASLTSKRLSLLSDLLPGVRRVGWLQQSENPSATVEARDLLAQMARKLDIRLDEVVCRSASEFDRSIQNARESGVQSLIIGNDSLFVDANDQLASALERAKMPAIAYYRRFCTAGGLAAYGPQLEDGFKQLGIYAAKILNGASPANLPIVQPSVFPLILNQSVARRLEIQLSEDQLLRADEVIE